MTTTFPPEPPEPPGTTSTSAVSAITAAMLTEAWGALSGDLDLLPLVRVTRKHAGLLPSTTPCTSAMVAAVAAATLAVSGVHAARTGQPAAPVVVDAEHVAVAARSERYALLEGTTAPESLFAPLSRFWRTRDGWLRLHTNYPWHRDRALHVLGCADDVDAVAAAVAERSGEELEEALAAAGALGFAVRTREQWAASPQGLALAALPLATSWSSDGPPQPPAPAPDAAAPLHGVRVLDLTRVIAGPVATRTLAAWGADVLRVDSPGLPEIAAQALDTLPGKRSTLLDLAVTADRARFEELLGLADVVVLGYRPGALDRFGLSSAALAERHPHLSVVLVSAWGPQGPWAGRRGFPPCPEPHRHRGRRGERRPARRPAGAGARPRDRLPRGGSRRPVAGGGAPGRTRAAHAALARPDGTLAAGRRTGRPSAGADPRPGALPDHRPRSVRTGPGGRPARGRRRPACRVGQHDGDRAGRPAVQRPVTVHRPPARSISRGRIVSPCTRSPSCRYSLVTHTCVLPIPAAVPRARSRST